MKRVLFLLIACLLSIPSLSCAIPQFINYQGRLSSADGTPVAGTKSMTFALYSTESGGAPLWSESQAVALTGGIYSVALGSAVPLPTSAFAGENLYLGVTVAGDTEMVPRQRITSVGYSFRTARADSVAPGAVTGAAIADGAVTDPKISDVSGSKVTGKIPESTLPANVARLDDGGKLPGANLPSNVVLAASLDATLAGYAKAADLAGYLQAPLRAVSSPAPPAPASPANAGRIYFDTATNLLMVSDGYVWSALGGRRLFYVSGNDMGDDKDDGFVAGRTLSVTKLRPDSRLRITYSDNLRVRQSNTACQWEIYLNGNGLTPQLKMALFTDGNTHRQSTLVGYATGVPAGTHQLQVRVSNAPGYTGADCYTGWQSSFLLEAEEVP